MSVNSKLLAVTLVSSFFKIEHINVFKIEQIRSFRHFKKQ